ncbi:MAG TPA: peptidoglycan-binding domain-containing protein [Candidatus Polarisedimenticolia bacterium]|nr:peptidoglycan-binding domain-containing protein [Candidatus Polarisedimenticolia bacterium]
MRGVQCFRAVATAAAMLLGLAASPLLAEDSNIFKNSSATLEAQESLEADGYLAHGDFAPGRLDQATRKALSEYQTAHALNSRGVLDDETFQMLTSHYSEYPWDDGDVDAEPPAKDEGDTPSADFDEAPQEPDPDLHAELRETHEDEADADAPAEEPLREEPVRSMPATGSSLPLLALSGVALIGAGLVLLRQRSA